MSDQILREAVRDLADEVRTVPGLVGEARRQGRRIKARRRTGVGLGVLAVAVAVAFVVVPRHPSPRPLPPVTATLSPTPSISRPPVPVTLTQTGSVTLAGGWQILAVGDWVLDGSRYREVHPPPNSEVLPSPDGKLVAVITTRASDVVVEIQRPDGTHVRTIHPGNPSGFSWSPWSDRLIAQAAGAKYPYHFPGYEIINVTTGSFITKYPSYADCSECQFVFTRDGTGVVLALPDRRGGEDELVASVDVFDAAGGALRDNYPITGMPLDPYAWSPDGRFAIGRVSLVQHTYALFDLNTSAATAFPCDGRFVDPNTVVCANGGEVDTYRPDGTLVARVVLGGAFHHAGAQPHVILGPGH